MKNAHRNHANHEDTKGTKVYELPERSRPNSEGSDWIRLLKCFLRNEPNVGACVAQASPPAGSSTVSVRVPFINGRRDAVPTRRRGCPRYAKFAKRTHSTLSLVSRRAD